MQNKHLGLQITEVVLTSLMPSWPAAGLLSKVELSTIPKSKETVLWETDENRLLKQSR